MIFGEECYDPGELVKRLDKTKAPYKMAPWEKVAWVREGVALLLAHEAGRPKVGMSSGELHRSMLWTGLRQHDLDPNAWVPIPKHDGPLYMFREDPREPMVEIDAKVARGLDLRGLDLYVTPKERREWVWVLAREPPMSFFFENPETSQKGERSPHT